MAHQLFPPVLTCAPDGTRHDSGHYHWIFGGCLAALAEAAIESPLPLAPICASLNVAVAQPPRALCQGRSIHPGEADKHRSLAAKPSLNFGPGS